MANGITFNPDSSQLLCDCQQPLPALVVQGLQVFNAGEYFEAHELLETAWRNESRPMRELYRGVLQVGVGFYHIQRENFSGAHKLFQRAQGWLSPFPANCQGVNVEKIRLQTQRIDTILISYLPNPSKTTLESQFFTIEFDLSPNGE
jgi:hypothetical protein